MAYTMEGSQPTYTLHRLSLTDFSDIVAPTVVAASHSLTDGSTFTFNATYQRQRPALLLDHGAVYAGFGSFCDLKYNQSRGWLLGWQADNLTPLTANGVAGTVMSLLTDQQPSNKNNFFLSAIWMSGAGPAADADGNVYVVTGNSSKFENTYNSATNLAESAIKFNPFTNSVTSYYTPANSYHLDQVDGDFGAGGIMLLPQSVTGLPSQLAVAAGKDGFLTLMDRTSLGGFATGPGGTDNPVTKVKMPACWCAPRISATVCRTSSPVV
jgi:hypothetical protein